MTASMLWTAPTIPVVVVITPTFKSRGNMGLSLSVAQTMNEYRRVRAMKNKLGFRCPKCGKFVSEVKVIFTIDEKIEIEGTCVTHGVVDVTNTADWWYEDFFPMEE